MPESGDPRVPRMRARLLLALPLLPVPIALVAAPPPETVAIDRAHEALAEEIPGGPLACSGPRCRR